MREGIALKVMCEALVSTPITENALHYVQCRDTPEVQPRICNENHAKLVVGHIKTNDLIYFIKVYKS